MTPSPPAFAPTGTPPTPLPPSRRWWAWVGVVVFGVAMAMAGSHSALQRHGAASTTAMVVARMQASAQAMTAQALMASRGDAGAIDQMRSHRSQLHALRDLLRTGGYADPSDPSPVLILEGRSGFDLAPLDQALDQFATQVRPLEESAAQLRQAAEAEATLAQSLSGIDQALEQMNASPSLASGAWANALASSRAVLSRPEMRTMQVIFSPLQGAEALQSSWAQQFERTASTLADVSATSARSSTLDDSAKAKIQALAQSADALAKAAAVLAASQPVRLAARRVQAPVQSAAQGIQQALGGLGSRVLGMQASRPWGWYVAWVGALVALAGLAGLARLVARFQSSQWLASQETRSGHGVAVSVERLTRQLRRILAGEDGASATSRLEEAPDAETFALASMVNSLLDAQDRLRGVVIHTMDDISLAVGDASGPAARLSAGARRLDDAAQQVSGTSRAIAQELARVAQAPAARRAQGMVEMTTAAEQVMQEGTFRMDSMRETVQGTSKHLKRLAEGAQSIAAATNVIDAISRRVKVLSTNAAIEAATHGDAGRKFAVLAKEIERLSQSAHEAAADIGQVVQAIQADAQETVAAMERSTTEVVASTDLALKAGQALREIERVSAELVDDIAAAIEEVEKQALAGVKLSQGCDQAATLARELVADGQLLGTALDRARARARDARQVASPEARS